MLFWIRFCRKLYVFSGWGVEGIRELMMGFEMVTDCLINSFIPWYDIGLLLLTVEV